MTSRLRVAGLLGLLLGVFLMHGLSGPNMSHDGLPDFGSRSHAMGDMKLSGSAHQRSGGTAMLTAACVGVCAYAVVHLTSIAAHRDAMNGQGWALSASRLPIGPLRGPEPPVPRVV